MAAAVYASRLVRLPVRAPDGGSVGIVRDLVIGPPAAGARPPVYGLVVTVPGRQIFLRAGRIAEIDIDGVRLRSGALNLRHFAQRRSETLVLGDLLDAADVLADLEPEGRARLLGGMVPGEAAVLRRLLGYGEDTAGGLMHPEPIACTPDTTVAEALARLRDPDVTRTMATQVFVVEPPAQTPTGTYLGTCGVQRLLREPPSRRLRSCVDPAPDPLDARDPVDDVLDHILPEDWRHR